MRIQKLKFKGLSVQNIQQKQMDGRTDAADWWFTLQPNAASN